MRLATFSLLQFITLLYNILIFWEMFGSRVENRDTGKSVTVAGAEGSVYITTS